MNRGIMSEDIEDNDDTDDNSQRDATLMNDSGNIQAAEQIPTAEATADIHSTHSPSETPTSTSTLFCTQCGARNDITGKFCIACGAPLHATQASTAPMQGPETPVQIPAMASTGLVYQSTAAMNPTDYTAAMPKAKRLSRKNTIILCSIVALFIAAVAIIMTLKYTVFSPEGPLKSYVSLVAAGQYDKATSMVDPGVPNASRKLLTDSFGQATKHRMEHVEIGKLQAIPQQPSTRKAVVSYTIDGAKQQKTLTLETSGKQWLFFDAWKITTPLTSQIAVTVPEKETTISVNGQSINLAKAGMHPTSASLPTNSSNENDDIDISAMKKYSLPSYPGKLSIALSDSQYLKSETVAVSSNKDEAFLAPSATEALTTEILSQMKQHMDTCAASVAVSTPGCDFSDGDFSSWTSTAYTNIKRSITDQPTLDTLDVYQGTFESNTIHTSISYQDRYLDSDPWQDESTTDSGTISGTFTINNGKVTVTWNENSNNYSW